MVYYEEMVCGLTWDVRPVEFNVHLVEPSLCGRVLHRDRPVFVVEDLRLGGFT